MLAVLCSSWVFASCGNKPSTSLAEPTKESSLVKKQPESPKPCQLLIDLLTRGDLEAWQGWPTGCDWASLEAVANFAKPGGHTIAGEKRHVTQVRRTTLSNLSSPLVVWHREGVVVRAYLQYPKIDDAAQFIKKLGEPRIKLDSYFATVPTLKAKSEWVYPSRGISLFMSTDQSKVVAVAVYPETTVERYKNELHEMEPPRELD